MFFAMFFFFNQWSAPDTRFVFFSSNLAFIRVLPKTFFERFRCLGFWLLYHRARTTLSFFLYSPTHRTPLDLSFPGLAPALTPLTNNFSPPRSFGVLFTPPLFIRPPPLNRPISWGSFICLGFFVHTQHHFLSCRRFHPTPLFFSLHLFFVPKYPPRS